MLRTWFLSVKVSIIYALMISFLMIGERVFFHAGDTILGGMIPTLNQYAVTRSQTDTVLYNLIGS